MKIKKQSNNFELRNSILCHSREGGNPVKIGFSGFRMSLPSRKRGCGMTFGCNIQGNKLTLGKKLILIFCLLFFIFSFAPSVHAASYTYKLMEKIPGFESVTGSDFANYVLAIYKFAIWTVGIAALLMITIGGFMYITSAGNTSRMDTAKRVIFDALYGLIVALAAWLLLYVINPDLVKVNISLKAVSTATTGEAVPTTPTGEPPTGGTADSCNGFSVSGISSSQCSDVSATLGDLLNCMYDKVPEAKISSISDSAGYDNCKDNWTDATCAHAKNSCHYGGSSCGNGSYAADFSTRNINENEIITAANECNANFVNDESSCCNHIHVSVGQSCGCN